MKCREGNVGKERRGARLFGGLQCLMEWMVDEMRSREEEVGDVECLSV